MERGFILANDLAVGHQGSMWLTTATVAHRLEVTAQWVRALARAGDLTGERTDSGQWLFRREAVWRYRQQQDEARTRSRRATLAWQRPRMIYSALKPRQLSLLPLLIGPARLQMVRAGEGSGSGRKVKAPQVGVNTRGSEKPRYVNRKIAGGRR